MAKRNDGGGGDSRLTPAQQKVADDAAYTIVEIMNDARTRLGELGVAFGSDDAPGPGYSRCRTCGCQGFTPMDDTTVICRNMAPRCGHHMSQHLFF